MKRSLTFVSLLMLSCGIHGGDEPQQVAVKSPNSLGVVGLEIERSVAADGDVFELVGLAANHDQVATVRLRIGTIAEIPDLFSTTNPFGSEIVFTYGTASNQVISRETRLFHLAVNSNPDIESFLEINEVATTLQNEANIVVAHGATTEAAYTEFTTQACVTSQILMTPLAEGCCETVNNAHIEYVEFKRGSDNAVVVRYAGAQNGYAGCTSETGGTCMGAQCFWGPIGYGQPSIAGTGASDVIVSVQQGDGLGKECEVESSGTSTYGNETGTFGTACGCSCDGKGTICLDTLSAHYKAGGTCPASSTTCLSTGCTATIPASDGGGADQFDY
jgi:hypothetical protein